MQRISIIKKALRLDMVPWLELPDDLLEMAFRPSNIIITKKLSASLKNKYGMTNLESLEFIGDAVLELAATQIIIQKSLGSPGHMTEKRQQLVRNTTLFCLMTRLNLCDLTERRTKKYKIKDCADILEAVIGVLYYYLFYIKKLPDYMNILQNYIETYLYDPIVLSNLFENGTSLDQCIIEGKMASELGNKYVIGQKKLK